MKFPLLSFAPSAPANSTDGSFDRGFTEQFEAIHYWAIGMAERDIAFLGVVDALSFAEQMMLDLGKCGVGHPRAQSLEVAMYVRTLHRSLRHPAETIMCALLSDFAVDHSSVTYSTMLERFGVVVVNACEALNKNGVNGPKDSRGYRKHLEENPVASIVKGAQRLLDYQSMLPFTLDRQALYIEEGADFYVPMLQGAIRFSPDQEAAYENIKMLLVGQMRLLHAAQCSDVVVEEKIPVKRRLLMGVNEWLQKWFGDTRGPKADLKEVESEDLKVDA